MARSIFSLGMFSFLACAIAVRSLGLESGSPPPTRAAMVISRISLVNTRPRLASVAAFLCLIVAHLECPDMRCPQWIRIFWVDSRSRFAKNALTGKGKFPGPPPPSNGSLAYSYRLSPFGAARRAPYSADGLPGVLKGVEFASLAAMALDFVQPWCQNRARGL